MRWRHWVWEGVLALSVTWAWAGEIPASSPPLSNAGPVLEQLGAQARDQSRSEVERLQLIGALGQWGTSQVREPLIALLKDPLPSLRAAAARSLGWPGNREAVAALRERVETPGEAPAVRAAALEALGRIGDPSVRGLLLEASHDSDPSVRAAALWGVTLGALVDPGDRVPLLIRLVGDDALDLQLRAQAIREMEALRDAAEVPVLTQILEHGPRITMPLPSANPAQREVMALRYQQARDLRAWAAKALGDLGERGAIPLLLGSAEDPDDFFLRLLSVQALIPFRAPEAFPVLERRLEDPFPMVRASALVGLAAIGDRRAVNLAIARLADEVPAVRAEAVLALAELGGPQIRPPLEALRRTEPDPQVQQALEAALAKLAP